jgi:hypothetical protein
MGAWQGHQFSAGLISQADNALVPLLVKRTDVHYLVAVKLKLI